MTRTDKTGSQQSREQWTAVSLLLELVRGARQHCVAKICNASQRANAHKLRNDPFTISLIKFRTLNSLAIRNTRCHSTCFGAQVTSKYGAWYSERLFGWRYISSLHSAEELQQERNSASCPLLRSCFIGSCHVGVSKRFSRSISLAEELVEEF